MYGINIIIIIIIEKGVKISPSIGGLQQCNDNVDDD